jgi:hypothetical protein
MNKSLSKDNMALANAQGSLTCEVSKNQKYALTVRTYPNK